MNFNFYMIERTLQMRSHKTMRAELDRNAPVKVYPDRLEFRDVMDNFKYQMSIHARNESRENQKLRIIPPTKPYFKIFVDNNQINVAPGLAIKINVLFYLEDPHAYDDEEQYDDKFYIMGNNFKTGVQLVAKRPSFALTIPKIFNLQTITKNRDAYFSIPLKNTGKGDVEIGCINSSTPAVTFEDQKLMIRSNDSCHIRIKTNFKKAGPIDELIQLPDGECIKLKGICIDEKIELYDCEGKKLRIQDLKNVYVGEKIEMPFYIANSSGSSIECLAKIFAKSIPDYIDIKIDEEKLAFVSRYNPKTLIEEENKINIKCESTKFHVNSFEDFQNRLILLKNPTEAELKAFQDNILEEEGHLSLVKSIFSKHQKAESLPQMMETLFVKIMSLEKPYKVLIKYTPIFPKIKISMNKFEFGQVQTKHSTKMTFTVQNIGQKIIPIKFTPSKIFTIEGNRSIEPLCREEYTVCFRPVIYGQYSEIIELSIFGTWKTSLRMYGECKSKFPQDSDKQNSLKRSSSNSSRFLSEQRKKRMEKEHKSLLKMKLTERSQLGFYKNSDLPIDLAFDACENPKVRQKRKFQIKPLPSGLYLKNDKNGNFLTDVKVNQILQNSARLNLKEVIKCSQELSIGQLSKIEVKGDKLDFGTIFVGSECQKDLIFCNRNSKPIYIELDMNKSQLVSQAKNQMKKIEAFGEMRCPIVFKSDHLGQFKTPIKYIINKHHIFEIDAVANVTLINVDFSTKELKYVFGPNDLCFQKVQTLQVTNQGGAAIKFLLVEPQNKSFCILSKKDQELKPKSITTLKIAYRPQDTAESGTQRLDQDKLIVKVLGGAENVIKLSGSVTEPKINIKENELVFSEVFVSMETWGKLTLRNLSKIETVAKIELSSSQLIEVFNFPNDMFSIAPEERKQIVFSFLSNESKVIKGSINVIVRGGKNFKIPVFINFVQPMVDVVGMDCIELDTVPVMNNRLEKQILLVNRNKSEIKLETNINDFEINDYMVEFITPHEGVELGYSFSDNKTKGLNNNKMRSTKQMISLEESAFSTSLRIKENDKVIHRVIYLAPGVHTRLRIKFIPKVAKLYEIKVPLLLHKACREIFPIQAMIKCKAVEPLFYIEPYSINFQNAIISDNQFAHMKVVTFVNPHEYPVYWKIEEQSLNEMFTFKEIEGHLAPNQRKKIEVYFRPLKEGTFKKKVLISSGNIYEGFVELELIGSAVSPKIAFTKTLLILPLAPLDTQTKGTLAVENEGFETVNISKWKISQTYPNTQFKVQFLDGRLLSLAKKRVHIEVSFKSSSPVSLTTNLELYDEFGEKIQIPISVTVQNCALTAFPYLEINSNGQIVKAKDNRLKLQLGQNLNPPIRKTSSEGCSSISGNFIRKWCSYELNLQFQTFPESFVESKGELFFQLVSRMSNGKNGLKKPNFDSEDKISRMKELHNFYANAIDILQSEGAFLNHIRPEHLLNVSDYLLFVMQKNMALQQEEFEDISRESWTYLFYQLCKIYVESNITEKFTSKLMIKKEKPDGLRSTIYSEQELLILKFLNTYLSEDKLYSFNDQARIFEILQKIIENTFKISLAQQLSNLRINADSMMLHEFLVIVSKFLHSHLQELGLAMYLQANDLFTMDHKQYILFFISLMNNLVHYQNSSVIEFECAVDECCRKNIELENPSKTKDIVYWVKIFGCETFSCETKSLALDKKEKATLELKYQCRKNKEEEARVLLVPIQDEDGFIPGHCLSFMLKNKIITKNVMKQVKYKAKLYETKSIFVDVELPDSEYAIKLVEHEQTNEFSMFYMISEPTRVIRGNKDRCELKISPLRMGDIKCQVVYTSPFCQEFTFEVHVRVQLPNILQTIKLPSMTIEKEQIAKVSIPYENQKKVQCLKFHREMKGKLKKKNSRFPSNQKKKTLKPFMVEINFADQSYMTTKEPWITLDPSAPQQNFIEIEAMFPKSYRNYTSLLLVKNTQIGDIRVYELCVSASMKPKYYNIKIKTKARQPVKHVIPNKLWPCFFKLSSKIQGVTVDHLAGSPELLIQYKPEWIEKEETELLVEQIDTFEQNIYRIKFEAVKPECIQAKAVIGSQIFKTTDEICLKPLKLTEKELQEYFIKTDIERPHTIQLLPRKKCIAISLSPGPTEKSISIKVCHKKSQAYFQIMADIQNRPHKQMPEMELALNIGEIKDYLLNGINYIAEDFKYEIQKDPYLMEYIVREQTEKQKPGFYLRFMPMKELNLTKKLIFYCHGVDYSMDALLIAKKVEPNFVNPIITHNVESKSITIMLTNIYDAQGKYIVQWADIMGNGTKKRFKADLSQFFLKSKDKILVKVTFEPMYIGETCQASMVLKSDTLPELTYIMEGQSKFKCIKETLDIETEGSKKFHEKITFSNNFTERDKFRFQIVPNDSGYKFQRGGHHFVEELESKQKIELGILRDYSKEIQKGDDKIVITKLKDRKVISQMSLNGLMIRKLEGKAFSWCCRARETIFQNIKLPNNVELKNIHTEPELRKYISFSTEENQNGEIKIKFSPLKPFKLQKYCLSLISDQAKFLVDCTVKVLPPKPDDSIVIRTDQVKEKGASMFRLTNYQRQSANFHAYLQKGTQQLSVEPAQGLLDPYGKQGTPITVSFMTEIHNKRVEDHLIVETNDMYWIFRVTGIQSKKLPYLKEK